MTADNTDAEVIAQMRRHVTSYKSVSLHRSNCLELCRRLENKCAEVGRLREVERMALIFFDDVLPQVSQLVLQDYANLNMLGIALDQRRREISEATKQSLEGNDA